MGFGSFLSNGLTAATNTVGAYQGAEQKASQDKMQQALQQMQLQRQLQQSDLAAQLTRSTIGKNNAQAAAAAKDITGHITGQDGTEYIIHSDGSLSPATMRGATTPTAPHVDAPPSSDEDSTGGGVGAGPIPQQVATPQVPKFGPKPKEPSTIPGTPEWKAAETEKAKIGAQYGYHPPPDKFTTVTVGGDDSGPAVVKPFNKQTGEAGAAVGTAKPTLRVESATNTAAKARLEAAVSEMNNAHSGMGEYEAKLKNHTANISGLGQFLGRVGSAFTHDDPASMAVQSAALSALNAENPELARYVRRGLSFAEGESMVSQRPSDFRTKMAAFLSQASSNAPNEMIDDIQSRRNSIMVPLNANVKPSGAPRGASSGNVNLGTPHVTPAERAALKAQGYTDAQIDAYKP